MPQYRYTMMITFNSGQPAVGFSESWTNTEAGDGAARQTMQSLISERRKVLSSSWSITGGRIGKLTMSSGSTPKIVERMVAPLVCQASNAGALGVADTPWAAVLIAISKASNSLISKNRPRQELFRGIPDSWWTNAALSIPDADKAALQGFFAYLLNPNTFGAGQAKINAEPALVVQKYIGICLKRIANRRIGRPFTLIRGRKWARRETA